MNTKVAASVLLALYLLPAMLTDAISLARMGSELRCQCVKTHSQFIHPTIIQDVKLTQSGPHCKEMEIIATLTDGREVCLDPKAAWVKQITNINAEDNAVSQL